jgi:hypothetical protein
VGMRFNDIKLENIQENWNDECKIPISRIESIRKQLNFIHEKFSYSVFDHFLEEE